MQLSVGRNDIMKIGYTEFYIFESARLQSKALYRRSLYRLFQERSLYCLFQKNIPVSPILKRALQRAPVPSGLPSSAWQRQRSCLQKRAALAVANRACHPGLPLELENLMTEMRMFRIIDKDNRYKTKHRLMEES